MRPTSRTATSSTSRRMSQPTMPARAISRPGPTAGAGPGPRAGRPIVVLSQVPPGFTRARQRAGRRSTTKSRRWCSAGPSSVRPTRNASSSAAPIRHAAAAAGTAAFLEAFGCPILPMRFESAELTKIAINCCLVASISVANTLAELCERIGADWSEIAPALKLDRRIGAYSYLTPGLGLAGGNLERDLATVIRLRGVRHRRRRGSRLDRQQPASARLGGAHPQRCCWQAPQARSRCGASPTRRTPTR